MATAEAGREGGVSACRVALAVAIVWAPALLIMAVVADHTAAYGHKLVEVIGSVYWGYGPGWGPGLIGMAWGFADAFIGTLIIVWIYHLLGRGGKACCSAGRAPEGGAES
ncbi:MAG TPA: hypothetical protein VMW52_08240 [Phycisphaerae bacterium]|nr:hypothetical protein [Phycisphaerae bacterium]